MDAVINTHPKSNMDVADRIENLAYSIADADKYFEKHRIPTLRNDWISTQSGECAACVS